MKRSLSVFWRGSRWALKAFIVVAALWVCALMLGLGWLNHQRVSLKPLLPYAQKMLASYNLAVDVKTLDVGFEQRLTFYVQRLKVRDTQTHHVLFKLRGGQVALANRRLLLGQLSPKHIQLEQAVAHVAVDDTTVRLGDLPLATLTEAQDEMPDVIAVLNRWAEWDGLESLRTVQLKESHLLVKDLRADVDWLVQDVGAQFTRYPDEGENVRVVGKVRQKQVALPMPFLAKITHELGGAWLEASVRFDHSDTDFVKDYIPPSLQDMLTAKGWVELGTRLGQGNKLEDPYFTLRLNEVRIFPEDIFSHPLVFDHVTLRGRYAAAPVDTLWIQELELVDDNGDTFQGQGQITALETDPLVDMTLTSDIGTLARVRHYLPDRKGLVKTSSWLAKATKDVSLSELTLAYKGKPSDLPFCRTECGVTAQAKILDGKLRFLEESSFAEGIKGTFELARNYVHVFAEEGRWAQQQGRNISVTVAGLFTPGDNYLTVEGEASGPLKPLLTALKTGLNVNDMPVGTGIQAGLFKVAMPLHQDDVDAELPEIQMDIQSDITNLQLPLAPLGNKILSAPLAALSIKDREVGFEAKGEFLDVPMVVRWQSHLERPDSSAVVRVRADVPLEDVLDYANGQLTNVVGTAAVTAVGRQSDEQNFNLEATIEAENTRFDVPTLNWTKAFGAPLVADVRGFVALAGEDSSVNLDMISVTGEGVEIGGSLFVDEDQHVTAQFAPFLLGDQNMVVQWQPGHIELVGKQLDLRGIDLLDQQQESTLPEALSVRLALENVLLEHGALARFSLQGERAEGQWQQFQTEGVVEDKPFGVTMVPSVTGHAVTLWAMDTGAVLRAVANYQQIRDGVLEGKLALRKDDQGVTVGDGLVTVHQARLVDIPVMAQLLALLSLEPLMDASSGIRFGEISVPLKIQGDGVHFPGINFTGSSMDMQLKGYYAFDGQVNFDGRLIPAVGINKTLAHLPLVGTLLAGSQDGVLVADFKIKGVKENPKVSVKPLSLVTPGLLKDIFGGIFGND